MVELKSKLRKVGNKANPSWVFPVDKSFIKDKKLSPNKVYDLEVKTSKKD